MTMCSGGDGPVEQALQRRHEIVGDGAAEAAVGQLDDGVLRAALDAAALQDLAVDADIAELVDDHGEPPAAGILQHMAHQRRLAGAEEAGDDRAGNLGDAHDCSWDWCGGFHRRHAGDGVLADMLGTVAPLRHALLMRPVQAGKIDDVAGMPIGIEVADHVGPLAGRRHGRTAAARAVRQAVGRHHRDPLVAVGAEPLLDRRQQTRARTLSIRGVRRDGRIAATGDADIENGGRHVRRGLPPPPWRCRPPAPPARPRP